MANNIVLVKEVMADEEFVAKISAMEDPAEVQSAFAAKGINFTIEQINQIAELVANSQGDELSEDALEAVSGGILAEITIVAGVIALGANCMAEYNKARKEQGKSTIW